MNAFAKILRKQNVTDTLSFVRSDGRENSIPSHKHSLGGGGGIINKFIQVLCVEFILTENKLTNQKPILNND